MANQPITAPSLEPSSVRSTTLQEAVDQFPTNRIVGLDQNGVEVHVVGVDIMPGIVVRQPDDSLEAAAKVYLELRGKSGRSTTTVRATVKFRKDGDDSVAIDEIVAATKQAA
ncbi:hypothetical protein [Caulobacter soli]|uniref:hypothetical protein n=1 Tax=Caulobacter soli TaxID=2708539 RepID=UPI0013ECB7EE|nr:hypothetical protein [Caulobacter soli]